MKKIGLIGGISWVSTIDYYRYINTMVNETLGGLQYPELIIYSFNYAEIKKNNDANDWDRTLEMLTGAARKLEAAGAEALILCANTMHLIADELQEQIGIPILHIAEATAEEISRNGIKKVALLGTKFTMEKEFFHKKLLAKGIEAIVPSAQDREFIHQTIFDELGKGELKAGTKARYQEIIRKMEEMGAGGVVLGCTEIPLLIKPEDVSIPVFDTTLLHSRAAAHFITGER
ncbi:MAG: aspartate/glutamate racemase family protein [Bacteroidia bacterium]